MAVEKTVTLHINDDEMKFKVWPGRNVCEVSYFSPEAENCQDITTLDEEGIKELIELLKVATGEVKR